MTVQAKQVISDGIWTNNPATVQMLGLCPLLAVSTSFASAVGLGLVTLIVLIGSNIVISLIRHFLDETTRLPAQIMVIATFVTLCDLLLQANLFDLHQRIGLFIALIVTNCALLGRAEVFASKQPVLLSGLDGLAMGTGFLIVIVVLGSVREIVGQGTLFSQMHLILGDAAPDMTLQVTSHTFLLAALPPGAFLMLALLIATKNKLSAAQLSP